jgi:ADP-ribose pyrophosphatase
MKLIESKKLLKTSIFQVTMDRALDPDGFEIKRAIVHHIGSAVVMPVDDRGRILLVRQFRLPANDYMWELPAGRRDPGETLLRAAKRELREETGLTAKRWTRLVRFFASPGFLAEEMTVFAAEGLTHGEQEPMEDERIQMKWFTQAEIGRMIDRGEIHDAKTLIGFCLWKRKARQRSAAKSSR